MRFNKTKFISRLSILVSLTLVIQIGGLPQPLTGPLINAMLLITTAFLGSIAGVSLACLTPLIALIRGQLPMVLAPMVPFIALSNIVLVLTFFMITGNKTIFVLLNRFKIYIAIFFAAIFKYLLLLLSVKIILPIIFGFQIPDKIIIMMTTPQIATAIIGGAIAFFFLKLLKRLSIEDTAIEF